MATDEQSGEATSPTSLLLSPFIQGSSPGLLHVELNEGQYPRFDPISFNLPGCDPQLALTSFPVSPNGKPVSMKPVMETYQRDYENPPIKRQVERPITRQGVERPVFETQIYGVTISDLTGALLASWPSIHPPVKRVVEILSEFAHKADAVLATCKGGDASSRDGTGGDASCLRAGLGRYQPPRQQVYGRESPFDADREGGVKMPPGMPRSTVLSPTLAIIFCYEWQLNTYREHGRNAVKMDDPEAELAARFDETVAFRDGGTSFQRYRECGLARVPDERAASWQLVPGGPWVATRKFHGPFKEIENRHVVYRVSIGIANTPITAGGKVMVDGRPSTTRKVPSKLKGQFDFEVELDCHRGTAPPLTYEIPLIRCCAFSPLPMPTPKQLVDTFPGKLIHTGQMLLNQLPSVRFVDPDTGREHNPIPIGAKWSIGAEARALQRAAFAAEHAWHTADPNASYREIMTAMLRAAKLSAYPPHETLDVTQQMRLCAMARDEWHCSDAMPIPEPTSQAAMEPPPVGDAPVVIRYHGGEVDGLFEVHVASSAANLNQILQMIRGDNGKESIALIGDEVPYAFSVKGHTITTKLEDAISDANLFTECTIDVHCKPRWVLVKLESEEGQTTGVPFRCIPERVNQQTLMFKLNGDLRNHPKLLYRFSVHSTSGNNQVTGTLSDAIGDAARGDDELVAITFKRDYSSRRLQDAQWAAWERGGKSAPMDEPSMADALPAANEAAEAADRAALSTELQSKLRALKDTQAPQQDCKKACSLYTGMLKLADHDVRDGGFDFDRQTMLKAGSEKADKDAATAALRAVRKITESRDDNDAKPEVVEHTGRKERKEGPFTIRCSNAAQYIFLADCLQEAYAAQCAIGDNMAVPVDASMPDAE